MTSIIKYVLAGGGVSILILYSLYKNEKRKRKNAEVKERKTNTEKKYTEKANDAINDRESKKNDIDAMTDSEIVEKWNGGEK